MPQVLEQRISANSHECDHCQRNQGHGHDDNANCSGHRNPFDFRVAHRNHKSNRLNSIPGFYHTAQQLAGIGVVCRDGIYVAVFLFFRILSPANSVNISGCVKASQPQCFVVVRYKDIDA